jgi:hypothetical protein
MQPDDEQAEEQNEPEALESVASVHFTLGQKAAIFLPAALGACGLDVLLHAPLPMAVGGVIGAFFLARNSPELYASLKASLSPTSVPSAQAGVPSDRQVMAVVRPGEWSLLDRLMGRHLEYVEMDKVQAQASKQPTERMASSPKPSRTTTRPHDWHERVLVPEPLEDEWLDLDLPEPPTPEQIDALEKRRGLASSELPAPRVQAAGPLLFSSVLTRFTPSLERIYLGQSTDTDGQALYCAAKDLCHVALAGNTGGGKSSLMRLLMAQLCRAGAHVLLLNPHYTRYDLDSGEDWTPFERYLLHEPMACKEYQVIEHYLSYAAEVLLPRRLEQRARSLPTGKPYFLVLDELPAIVRHIRKAPDYLRELLEEGRKVGIFLICAAQDFLVKTIAPDSGGGSIRECYRTAYYVGGDSTTARLLLDLPPRSIPEEQLGKGTVMLRCASVPSLKQAKLVRVPLLDNAALYRLLGPSTYKSAQPEPERSVPVQMSLDLPGSPTAPMTASAMPEHPSTEVVSRMQTALQNISADELLALLMGQLPEVDPTDSRYGKNATEHEAEQPKREIHPPQPVEKDKGPRAEEIDLTAAIALWNSGYNSDRKLAKVFHMTLYQANRLARMIEEQAKKQATEDATD